MLCGKKACHIYVAIEGNFNVWEDLVLRRFSLFSLITIPYNADKKLFLVKVFENIIYGALPIIEFYAMSNFIDSSIASISEHEFYNVWESMIILIIVIGFKHLHEQIFRLSSFKLNLETNKHVRAIFLNKKAKLDCIYMETEDIYDKGERLSANADQRILNGLTAVFNIIMLFIKVGMSLYITVKYLGINSLVIIAAIVPIFILSKYTGKITYKTVKRLTGDNRVSNYISSILTDREYCEERTLFSYSTKLNDKWKDISRHTIKTEYLSIAKIFLTMDISGVMMIILSGMILYFFTLKAISRMITLGIIISLTNLFKDLCEQLRWDMMDNISNLYESKEYFDELNEYMLFKEKEDMLEEKTFKEFDPEKITLKSVSFGYCNENILNNISFEFERGKHYAIVGRNGSGKSTLVKLLIGMYDNYKGEILIDNTELRDLKINDIRNIYSVVFQDFARYPTDIKSNVIFGDISDGTDLCKFYKCIKDVGMYDFISGLNNKEDTLLGKIMDNSIELSGGQWQKLAMARALYNPAKIRILDEPTAAMDPVAESELYENFMFLSKGVTSIFISHRLGSIMLADIIIVMDEGTVIETGTHEQLMKKRGTYYNLYCEQRKWYE